MTAPDSTCSHVLEDLVAFLDGELEPARAKAVAAHLAGCVACEAERAALTASFAALDLLEAIEPRKGFAREVEAAVLRNAGKAGAAPAGKVLRFPGWIGRAAAAAAVVLLTLGAWAISRGGAGPDASPSEIAVQPDRPAPEAPRSVDVAPRAPEDGATDEGALDDRALADAGHESVLEELPADLLPPLAPAEGEPEAGPSTPDTALASAELPASVDDLDGDELAVVQDLELLVFLQGLEESDVVEALDVLDDMDDEELNALLDS